MKVIKKGHGYNKHNSEIRKNYRTHLSKWYYKHNSICKKKSSYNKHKYKMICSIKTAKRNPLAIEEHDIEDCDSRRDLNVIDMTSSHNLIAYKNCSDNSVCTKIFPLSKCQNIFKPFQFYINLGNEIKKNSKIFMQNYWVYPTTLQKFKRLSLSVKGRKKPIVYIPPHLRAQQTSPELSTETKMDNKKASKKHDKKEAVDGQPDSKLTSADKKNQKRPVKATESKGNQLPAKEVTSKTSKPASKVTSKEPSLPEKPATKVTSKDPSLHEKRDKKEKKETQRKEDTEPIGRKDQQPGNEGTPYIIPSAEQNDKDKRKTKQKDDRKLQSKKDDQQPSTKITSGKPSPSIKESVASQKENREPTRKLGNEDDKKLPPRKEKSIPQTGATSKEGSPTAKQTVPSHDQKLGNEGDKKLPPRKEKPIPQTGATSKESSKQAVPSHDQSLKTPTKHDDAGKVRSKPSERVKPRPSQVIPLGDISFMTQPIPSEKKPSARQKEKTPIKPDHKEKGEDSPATGKDREPHVTQVTPKVSSPSAKESLPSQEDKVKPPTKRDDTGKVRSKPSERVKPRPSQVIPLGDISFMTQPVPSEKESSAREKAKTPLKPDHKGKGEDSPATGKDREPLVTQVTPKVSSPSAKESLPSQEDKVKPPTKRDDTGKARSKPSERVKPRPSQVIPLGDISFMTQPIPSEKKPSARQKEKTPIKPDHKEKGEDSPATGKDREPLVTQVTPKVSSPSAKESLPSQEDKVKPPTKRDDTGKVRSKPSERVKPRPSQVIPLGDISFMTQPVPSEKESSTRQKEKTPLKPEHKSQDEDSAAAGKDREPHVTQVTPKVSSPSAKESLPSQEDKVKPPTKRDDTGKVRSKPSERVKPRPSQVIPLGDISFMTQPIPSEKESSAREKAKTPLKPDHKGKGEDSPATGKDREPHVTQVTPKVSSPSAKESLPSQEDKVKPPTKRDDTGKVRSKPSERVKPRPSQVIPLGDISFMTQPVPSEKTSSPSQKEKTERPPKHEHKDKPTAVDKNKKLAKKTIPTSPIGKKKIGVPPKKKDEDKKKRRGGEGKEQPIASKAVSPDSSMLKKKQQPMPSKKKNIHPQEKGALTEMQVPQMDSPTTIPHHFHERESDSFPPADMKPIRSALRKRQLSRSGKSFKKKDKPDKEEKKLRRQEPVLEESRSRLRVQFTDPQEVKKQFVNAEFLELYDPEVVKKTFAAQIQMLRDTDEYTDSEFDDLDDEIYEIVLSYATKRRKFTTSEISLELAKSRSSGVIGAETNLFKDILGAFRRQRQHSLNMTSSSRLLKHSSSMGKTSKVMIDFKNAPEGEKLNLPTTYIVTVEDVESTLLRDFSPARIALSEDRCFRVFITPEAGPQVSIPNAFYNIQEFVYECGYDPEGPLLTDQVNLSKFQICLDVANMYYEEISQRRAALLMYLALTAPNSVQGFLRQLAESVVNRRINSEDEINGFLNKVHEMAQGMDTFTKIENFKKAELDNFRLIQKLKKKIFSEFYRKVGFWDIKNGEKEVVENHLALLRTIPRLYKTGFFPFIDFISEFIAKDKIITQDQLEVALNRFLASSDGRICRNEFSEWCSFGRCSISKSGSKSKLLTTQMNMGTLHI